MSRAFVKDDDDRPEPTIERSASDDPNYVTPHGLALLREALARAEASGDERNARYYRERVASAIEVDLAKQPRKTVKFGASVVVRTQDGAALRVRIVGEDEADPSRGTISWRSPFADGLLGRRLGSTTVVRRPAGEASVKIESIDYESE